MVEQGGGGRSRGVHGTHSVRRNARLRTDNRSQSRLLPGALSLVALRLGALLQLAFSPLPPIEKPRNRNAGDQRREEDAEQRVQPDQRQVESNEAERHPQRDQRAVRLQAKLPRE